SGREFRGLGAFDAWRMATKPGRAKARTGASLAGAVAKRATSQTHVRLLMKTPFHSQSRWRQPAALAKAMRRRPLKQNDTHSPDKPRIISEQHRDKGEKNGWYADASGRSAIAVLGKLHVDAIGPRLHGISRLELNGFRLYSCYCSPNIQLTEFEVFLGRLEASIREARCPVIIAGDFNAKSHEWGSPREDKKGKAMADLAASLGLVVCNQGKEPTFVKGASESHIDLTLVSHNAKSQLDRAKLEEALKCNAYATSNDVEEASDQTIGWLSKACDASMPRSGKRNRQPVPWWNTGLTEQRKKCLKARRVYTRKRKKSDENGCIAERPTRKKIAVYHDPGGKGGELETDMRTHRQRPMGPPLQNCNEEAQYQETNPRY
ncbi:reverse transcriptase, partial [Thalictrum thalictroides]